MPVDRFIPSVPALILAIAGLAAPLGASALTLVDSKSGQANVRPQGGVQPSSTPTAESSNPAEPSALLLGLAAVVGIGYVVGRRSGRD